MSNTDFFSWFKKVSFEDRKALLHNLHDLRRELKFRPNESKIVEDLISKLEDMHEEIKAKK
jgi:hypothetical protein